MDKRTQIDLAQQAFDGLIGAIEGMSEDELTDRGIGDWGVREVLAHIVGWTRRDSRVMERIGRGERPFPEGEEYGTGESRNPGFAAAASSKSSAQVLAEMHDAWRGFIAAAETVPDDRYNEGRTASRLIRESATAHLAEHCAEIERYRQALTNR